MKCRFAYAILLTTIVNLYGQEDNSSQPKINSEKKNNTISLSRKDLYIYGFKIKRAEQVEGVKRIAKMSDYAKKYAMIKVLLEKMFKVLMEAKVRVVESGYIPGEEFPEDPKQRDDLGNVFENVAFFGDLLLRCPDITHKLYDSNKEWQVTMNWGVVFSNETQVFEGANAKLLDLVAQELEIIPRDDNYVNPYKEATIKAEQERQQLKEEEIRKQKEKKILKRKARMKRGPRLGGSSGEL